MINTEHFDKQSAKPCRNLYAVNRPWYNSVSGKERGNKGMSQRKWSLVSCVLWIAGLAVFIVGLNLSGNAKEWMTVAGSVVFLAGLGIAGVIWVRQKKDSEEEK